MHVTGILSVSLACVFGCGREESEMYQPTYREAPIVQETQYIFGVHPLHNPQRLDQIYGPLMELLSERIEGADFILEASRDYATYDRKLADEHFHFALPNPLQTLNAMGNGYAVFAKMADDEDFRGIILVRRDAGIESVEDLIGGELCFPAPTALAGTLMPQFFLHQAGLDMHADVRVRYVGSQESSIMNVYYGEALAGATWPPPWRALLSERPELDEVLEVKWRTPPLPSNGLVARLDVPEAIVREVEGVLVRLHQSPQGQALLKAMELSAFEAASSKDYLPVQEFLIEYRNAIGAAPEEQPLGGNGA
jgi:phosphonate transport system substrate-binding protein